MSPRVHISGFSTRGGALPCGARSVAAQPFAASGLLTLLLTSP